MLYRKNAICLKDYRITSFLSIQYVHGDLCKHLGIDSSRDDNKYNNKYTKSKINLLDGSMFAAIFETSHCFC